MREPTAADTRRILDEQIAEIEAKLAMDNPVWESRHYGRLEGDDARVKLEEIMRNFLALKAEHFGIPN